MIFKLRNLVKLDSNLFRKQKSSKRVLSSQITAYTPLWEIVIFPAILVLSLESILHIVLFR